MPDLKRKEIDPSIFESDVSTLKGLARLLFYENRASKLKADPQKPADEYGWQILIKENNPQAMNRPYGYEIDE